MEYVTQNVKKYVTQYVTEYITQYVMEYVTQYVKEYVTHLKLEIKSISMIPIWNLKLWIRAEFRFNSQVTERVLQAIRKKPGFTSEVTSHFRVITQVIIIRSTSEITSLYGSLVKSGVTKNMVRRSSHKLLRFANEVTSY